MSAIRRIFLVLFALSTLGVLVLSANLMTSINAPASALTENPGLVPTVAPGHPEVNPDPQVSKDMGVTVLIGSVITSVTSLIGFVTTTIITWRKEKRDASLADVQREKLETELEKSKLELEKLKKSKTKKRKK